MRAESERSENLEKTDPLFSTTYVGKKVIKSHTQPQAAPLETDSRPLLSRITVVVPPHARG